MTGEDIQRNLVDFARKWSLYEGSERAEAQTFVGIIYFAHPAPAEASHDERCAPPTRTKP